MMSPAAAVSDLFYYKNHNTNLGTTWEVYCEASYIQCSQRPMFKTYMVRVYGAVYMYVDQLFFCHNTHKPRYRTLTLMSEGIGFM